MRKNRGKAEVLEGNFEYFGVKNDDSEQKFENF